MWFVIVCIVVFIMIVWINIVWYVGLLYLVLGCFVEMRIVINFVWIVYLNFWMIGIGYYCVWIFCIYCSFFFGDILGNIVVIVVYFYCISCY